MSKSNGDQLKCKGEKSDGTPCGAPPSMVNEETGYCPAHDPDRAEERRETAHRAAEASIEARRDKEFRLDELPELNGPKDAEAWMEIIIKAMLAGRLSQNKMDLARKGLKVWLKAHDKGQLEDRFDRLEDALKTYRETGDPDQLLDLVDAA